MTAFWGMFTRMLLFTALGLPGFLLGKANKLGESSFAAFGSVLTYFAMPALVFAKLIETDLTSLAAADLAAAVIFPIFSTGALFLVCFLCFKDARAGVARFCAILPNCGFLGLPLAELLFGDRPFVVLYLSVFNAVNTLILLTFGERMLAGKGGIRLRSVLMAPVVFALIGGVIGSLCGIAARVPLIDTYANYGAALTAPLSMTVLGAQLAHLPIREYLKDRTLYAVCAIKLVLSPFLSIGALWLLRRCGVPLSTELAAAVVLATGVSTAASAPAMAAERGADSRYAAALTLTDTLVCVVTLPLILTLFPFLF